MYIQITTRCNMRCAHCCYSCTRKGEDMPLNVFQQALAIDDYVTIGGGEPTCHKMFWEFLDLALDCDVDIFMVTNGKRKRDAWKLLDYMNTYERLRVCLSLDRFHEPIDPGVAQAFRARKCVHSDKGFIPVRAGRWKGPAREDNCACSDRFVKPNGDIMVCGCADAPKLTDVWDQVFPDYNQVYGAQGICHTEHRNFPYMLRQCDDKIYIDDMLAGGTLLTYDREKQFGCGDWGLVKSTDQLNELLEKRGIKERIHD